MNKYSYKEVAMNNSQNENSICGCNIIHEDIVNKVSQLLPADDLLYKLSDFFKIIGDKTRIKILHALFESEMCVCDIAYLLNMNQSAISHQLRVLKTAGLVKFRKEGKVVYYSLDDDHVKNILDQGLIHLSHK